MTNVNTPILGSGPFILDQKEGPFSSTSAALTAVPANDRKQGQTIKIIDGGVSKFYWFRDGVADEDLIQMSVEDIAGALKTLTKVSLTGSDTLNASLDTFINSLTTSGNNTINLPEATDDDIGRQIVVLLSSGTNSTTVQSASDIIVIGGSSPTTQSVELSGYYKFAIFTVTEAATWRLDDGITSYNVLTRDNTSSYTPTSDYHPATKKYVDDSVTGLFDDRGNYDASGNAFPTSGGSGSGGAILKGDVWTISVAGTLGGVAVTSGDTIRALTDTPGQTASNWATTEVNLGYTPENVANKETSALDTSTTKYPCNNVVKNAVDAKADANNVLTLDNATEFTPDADYEPATKKYVDDNAGGGGLSNFDYIPDETTITSSASKDFSTDDGKMFYVSATGGAISITLTNAAVGLKLGFARLDTTIANDVTLSSGGNTYKLGCGETVFISNVNNNASPTPSLKQITYGGYLYAHPFMKSSLRKTTAGDARYYFGLPQYVNTGTFDFNASMYQIDGEWISDTTTSNTPKSLGGNYWHLKTSISGSLIEQTATKLGGIYSATLRREYNGSSWTDWYFPDDDFAVGINDTGSQINAGEVVRVYYDSATDNRYELIEAQANNSSNVLGEIGFLVENTADQAVGLVMKRGTIGGVDTSGLTIGDEVYLSSATEALFTTTKPTGPDDYVVELGTVKTVNASTGEICVDVKSAISVFGESLLSTNGDAKITQEKFGDIKVIAALAVNKSTGTVIKAYNCTYSSVGSGEFRVVPLVPFPVGAIAVSDAMFPSGVSIAGVSKIAAVSTSYIQVLTEYSGTTYNSEYSTCIVYQVI